MIGLVLVTHGNLANEFHNTLRHIIGPQEQLETVCIGADDDMEIRRDDIAQAVSSVDSGKGVIILTDLFGGTPSNMAISLMPELNIEVIAGINLPLLVKLATARKDLPMMETALAAQTAGRKYIQVASKLLDED